MSKDQFDDLMKRLQNCLNKESDEERLLAESELKTPYLIEDQLNILHSRIILEGYLRGKQLTGSARRYDKYQINDLEGFVAEIANTILFIDHDWSKDMFNCIALLNNAFSSEYYEKLIIFLREKWISKAKEMENIKNKFIALKKDLKNKIHNSPKLFQNNKRIIYKNVDYLFVTFKAYIPDAHEETIADRITELLKEFDIDVKPGTILQRRYRARK